MMWNSQVMITQHRSTEGFSHAGKGKGSVPILFVLNEQKRDESKKIGFSKGFSKVKMIELKKCGVDD